MGHCACDRPLEEDHGLFSGDRLLLWPPMLHTAAKLRTLAAESGLPSEITGDGACVIVHLGRAVDSEPFWTRVAARLTEEELDATRALIGTHRSPTIEEIPNIRSLRYLLAARDQRWFERVLVEGHLTCAFQPIVEATSRKVAGHEALLRARLPDGSVIAAAQLLGAARALGKLVALDVRARLVALEQLTRHRLPGIVFINFIPSAIYDPKTCLRQTWEAARRLGVEPGRIVFEVIETESLTNLRHVRDVLLAYRSEGFRVALDDIGSGYSSLLWLSDLQPDFLKIDRAIVRGCAEEAVKRAIIAKVTELAHAIGAAVVAEGVETGEDAQAARELGVDLMQGYLFGRPTILDHGEAPANT
ncbi:MAG: EAL domain-containing protein [Thermomicrobium sp.]|nr:EAL domain-containing protein [Thermomicrobium sp.]